MYPQHFLDAQHLIQITIRRESFYAFSGAHTSFWWQLNQKNTAALPRHCQFGISSRRPGAAQRGCQKEHEGLDTSSSSETGVFYLANRMRQPCEPGQVPVTWRCAAFRRRSASCTRSNGTTSGATRLPGVSPRETLQ